MLFGLIFFVPIFGLAVGAAFGALGGKMADYGISDECIRKTREKVMEVSKKWFRLRDSYGVAIDPGQDDVLILAVAVCIDEMAHRGR